MLAEYTKKLRALQTFYNFFKESL